MFRCATEIIMEEEIKRQELKKKEIALANGV
jgi:hypothetical protein